MRGGDRVAGLALLAPCAVLLALMVEAWPVTVDDAYIAPRHARHWLEHGNPSFDATERIEAYSTFTWVVLAAAALRVHADPLWVGKALGGASALACVLLAFAMARRLGAGPGFAWLGAALVGVSTGMGFWAVSGMETASFALLLSAGVWVLLDPGRAPPWLAAGLLLAAVLTRIEGPVLVGAAIVARAAYGRSSLGSPGDWS